MLLLKEKASLRALEETAAERERKGKALEPTPFLDKRGDGYTPREKRKSGWNKVVNALLCALRDRCKQDENWLHSLEQLALFRGCVNPPKKQKQPQPGSGEGQDAFVLADVDADG